MHTGSLNCRFRWQPDTHAPSALGATAGQRCRKHLAACPHALTAPRRQPASREQRPTVLTSFSEVDEMPSAPEMPGPSTLATQCASSTMIQPLDPPRSTGNALSLLFALPMPDLPCVRQSLLQQLLPSGQLSSTCTLHAQNMCMGCQGMMSTGMSAPQHQHSQPQGLAALCQSPLPPCLGYVQAHPLDLVAGCTDMLNIISALQVRNKPSKGPVAAPAAALGHTGRSY